MSSGLKHLKNVIGCLTNSELDLTCLEFGRVICNLRQRARYQLLTKNTFTFHFSILTLSNTFVSINDREMKSESGFSLAMQWLASL